MNWGQSGRSDQRREGAVSRLAPLGLEGGDRRSKPGGPRPEGRPEALRRLLGVGLRNSNPLGFENMLEREAR